MPAGGGDVSVHTRGPVQCHQEAVLCRVSGPVTSDRCQEAREEYPINNAEDSFADQLQARRRAVECQYPYCKCPIICFGYGRPME